VGGGAAAIEQTGLGQYDSPGADRSDPSASTRRTAVRTLGSACSRAPVPVTITVSALSIAAKPCHTTTSSPPVLATFPGLAVQAYTS
jgi:hypothetical protein